MLFLRVLARRHLAVLWGSQVLSAIGDYFYLVAVLWLAVQVAGAAAGYVAAAQSLAALAFGLVGGVFADRWDRRRSMVSVDLLRAAAVAALPVLAALHVLRLWHLVAVGVIVGGLGALFDPALQASLPDLAGDGATLQAANGLMDITRRLARAVGPSLAGLLATVVPVPQLFTLDAVSFAVSAGAVASLGGRFAWRATGASAPGGGPAGVAREIAGAVGLLRRHRPLVWAFVSLVAVDFVWGIAFTVGAPLYAREVLRAGVAAYGLIVGAYGVGNVASNLVLGSLVLRRRVATLFAGRLLLGAGFLLLAGVRSLPLAMLATALAATGGPMNDISSLLMIQTDMPAAHIGKVYSLRATLESGGLALGLLLAPAVYGALPVPPVIALCALVMLASGVAGLLRFGLREPEPPPALALVEEAGGVTAGE